MRETYKISMKKNYKTSSQEDVSAEGITAAHRSGTRGNKPATLPVAGLVLDNHKSECYAEKTDGDANQLLMSLSPSVINTQHFDLWLSRMAYTVTALISRINLHCTYNLTTHDLTSFDL